jgi:D-lactate dehydrogenase
MKIAIFSVHGFDKPFLEKENKGKNEITFFEEPLSKENVHLAKGFQAVALFTSDKADSVILETLKTNGVEFIALRSVGYDHVDLIKAKELNIKVANVPEYSPHAIAEFSVAMMLLLNRKLVLADNRIKRHDFRLDGLTGFDMHKKTVGIIGTGKIGSVLIKILRGFGCKILGYDIDKNPELVERYDLKYVSISELCTQSDIISINCPLNEDTKYLIDEKRIAEMKEGVMLINTARGAIINTQDILAGLMSKKIGSLGIDVYEEEAGLFSHDKSQEILQDKTIALLSTFSNVLITAHQAFLTNEALKGIAKTTFTNIEQWQQNGISLNDLN